MSIKEEIAKNLMYYRKKSKYTQKELASKLGVKNSAISNWETGINSIDIDTLYQICIVLGISFNELFGKYADKNFDSKDYEIIKKYHLLNESDKSTVDFIFNKPEYQSVINNIPSETPELTADLDMDEFFRIEDEQYDTIAADEGGVTRRKIK